MQVEAADRGKVIVLLVAIVALLAFGAMNLSKALRRPAPAATAPPAAAKVDTTAPAPARLPDSMGARPSSRPTVNPFRMTVDPKITGEAGTRQASSSSLPSSTPRPPTQIQYGNLRPIEGVGPVGGLAPVQPEVSGLVVRLQGTMLAGSKLAFVKLQDKTIQLREGDDLGNGFKIVRILDGAISVRRGTTIHRLSVGQSLSADGRVFVDAPAAPSS